MVTLPGATPVTIPPEITVAVPVAALLHVPPGVTSFNVVVEPTQKLTGPEGVMAAGKVFTVTVAVTKQEPTVYLMVSTPADTPVTIPPEIVACELLTLQVPLPVPSMKLTALPIHTEAEAGEMAAGGAATVIIEVAAQPPTV